MATLEVDRRNGNEVWYVRFYYDGKRYKHSCRKAPANRAQQVLATVEVTLEKQLNRPLTMPDDADPRVWIVSGGRPSVPRRPPTAEKDALEESQAPLSGRGGPRGESQLPRVGRGGAPGDRGSVSKKGLATGCPLWAENEAAANWNEAA